MSAQLVTQAAYARHRGVSQASVHQAVKDGRIHLVDGKVDVKAADKAWAASTDTSKPRNSVNGNPRRRGAPETTGLARHRSTREEWRAKREELEYRQMAGELLERVAVEKAVFDSNRRARDRLRLIVSRLGAMLTPELREMLRKEIRDACDELGPGGRSEPAAAKAS